MWRDLRYAIRLNRREPGFAAVAILTMALGIGATTALFSVAYGVLLRPLPWADADRLVRATETRQGRGGRVAGTVSNATFLAWRDHPSTIEDLGGWLTQTATLSGAGDPQRLLIVPTTPSLFPMLRVRPLLGRLFDEAEGDPDQPGFVVLSWGLWQERFGGRPEILGHFLQLDDQPYTIVGVMPRDFAFPDREARAWTAWNVPPVVAANGMRMGVVFRAIARLRADATAAQAAAEATSRAQSAPDLGNAARALFGAVGPIAVSVTPELQAMTAEIRPAILVLLAAVGLLLIAATANVASLQLARAITRRRELAVRAAIGAGQRRLVSQLLIEAATIGLAGGVTGTDVAAALQRLMPALLPAGFPRIDAVTLDVRVLSFALAMTVLASVVGGLLPARYIRSLSLTESLSDDGVASIGGRTGPEAMGTRSLVMAGQVAIACILLVAAALLTRSFVAMVRADRGFDPVNVLTARLPFPREGSAERRTQVLEALVDRLRVVPGITHVAYGTALPLLSFGGFTAFTMRSPLDPSIEKSVQAAQRVVSPDYFGAMRLRLVAGRTLTDADTTSTPPAIVVNRTFARQYIGDRPIGFHIPQSGSRAGGIRFADPRADWTVVGVVDDMRQEVDAPLQPEIFASMKQITTATTNVGFDPILVIRTADDPTAHVPALRRLVHELAPAMALDSVMTMEDRMMTSLAKPRLYAVLLVLFAVFAALITGVGLFGVLSFSVAQRAREIGVRSALGARAYDIVSLVLRQAIWIVAIGALFGLALAVAGVRLLSGFLFGIGPYDPLTLGVVPIVILIIAVVACLVPAYRATKVDPLTALRMR